MNCRRPPAILLALSLALSLALPAAMAHAADGEAIWRQQCGACHTAEPGLPSGIGPNLSGVVGRKAGAVPGFGYSPAMKAAKLTWTKSKLKAFLANPQSTVPGNRMPFAGMTDAATATALVDWLTKKR